MPPPLQAFFLKLQSLSSIGGLTGTLTLPANGADQYGLSHVYVFNPGETTVPDSGAALMLLGVGLSSLEFLRRKALKK